MTECVVEAASERHKWATPENHEWFDGWMIARGDALKQLVEDVLSAVDIHERTTGSRRRARKAKDQERHRRRVEALVCHLARSVLDPPETGRIAVRLGHGAKALSRYDGPVFGKPLSALVYALEAVGVLIFDLPKALRGEVSSVRPTERFEIEVKARNISLGDIGRDPGEEVVILRPKKAKKGIEYRDTDTSLSIREAMRRINGFLEAADISFIDDGVTPAVDTQRRRLRRIFHQHQGENAEFTRHGRLYGGFWQNLSRERRKNLQIDGEPIVELDFSAMNTRLAYARLGIRAPEGDLYVIPGLEDYRSGVKLAMNCFMSDSGSRRKTWPDKIGIGVGTDADAKADPASEAASFEGRLPSGSTVAEIKKRILEIHPCLKDAWGRSWDSQLVFTESEILMRVLNTLMSQGVTALPIHDAVLVQASKAETAKAAMEDASLQVTGTVFPVKVKAVGCSLPSHSSVSACSKNLRDGEREERRADPAPLSTLSSIIHPSILH